MRLALLQDHLRMGGTERQALFLADAFAARGHAVELLVHRPGGPLAGTVASLRATTRFLQPFDLRLDWPAPGLHRRLAAFRPDALLLMGRSAHLHGAFLNPPPGTALVATIRTGRHLPGFHRRAIRRAAGRLCNSHAAATAAAAACGLPIGSFHVIHNALRAPPLDRAGAAIARVDTRSRLGAPPGVPVLLCVAMLRPGKNHRLLLDALDTLPGPLRLWLAGDGPARRDVEDAAARARHRRSIHFLGTVDDPRPLLAGADIAVLASGEESLPNFLIEAQAAGLPVVATDAGGVRECLRDGSTGLLVPPGNAATLGAAIDRLARDPPLRDALGIAAARWARENFDPDRQVDLHLDWLAHLTTTRDR